MPGCDALQGLGKMELKEKGKKEGMVWLVFINAYPVLKTFNPPESRDI